LLLLPKVSLHVTLGDILARIWWKRDESECCLLNCTYDIGKFLVLYIL
jgi:hypothetical protein